MKSASASDILQENQLELAVEPKDVREGIQSYVDKAFNTPGHPLGGLLNKLELVYKHYLTVELEPESSSCHML